MILNLQGDQIITLQEQKLLELLEYVALNSPFYKELFVRERLDIDSIRTLNDLSRIPPTTKADLQTQIGRAHV